MSQTPDELRELGRIFTAVGNGAQWQFATLTRPEAWHDPDTGFDLRRAVGRKYHIRLKPWTPPPPPEGREWNQGEKFTADDLPEGYRPMLVGEDVQKGDECWERGKGPWVAADPATLSKVWHVKHRTRRPLPKPDPYAELKAAHAAGKVIEYSMDLENWEHFANGRVEPKWTSPPEHYRAKLVPLCKEDIPTGSGLRNAKFYPDMAWVGISRVGVKGVATDGVFYSFETLARDPAWEIQRPGQDWKPCHKEPS